MAAIPIRDPPAPSWIEPAVVGVVAPEDVPQLIGRVEEEDDAAFPLRYDGFEKKDPAPGIEGAELFGKDGPEGEKVDGLRSNREPCD